MIIYKVTNLINKKIYIGQTIQKLNTRILRHARDSKKDNNYFHNAIHKHGIDNFKWEIICECETKEILTIMETFMIMVHKSHVSENGYNLTWGGEGRRCFKHSEESRKKMSETRKLRNDIKKLGQILMSFYEVGTLYNN